MSTILPAPNYPGGPDMWVDERIWGHRFHNEQTPWLVMLEFLSIFAARGESALVEEPEQNQHEHFQYRLPQRVSLRSIVFKNPHLARIEQAYSGDDARCWKSWFDVMGNSIVKPVELQNRFQSYSDFVRVVEFFISTAIEPDRNRRWSSRFVYPYGPHCIYGDMRERGGRLINSDRLFFARGGELLYLMLSRSKLAQDVANAVSSKLLNPHNQWNRVAQTLSPQEDGGMSDALDIGYLPHAQLLEYEWLAEDWLRLLRLNLPGAVVLDPLVRITGLNLILYHVRRSLEVVAEGQSPALVLEIAAPSKSALVNLSKASHNDNAKMSRKAVVAFLNKVELNSYVEGEENPYAIQNELKEKFRWRRSEEPSKDPYAEFKEAAILRHRHHGARIVSGWSRNIGLSCSRAGVGTWYRPDDSFLRAVLLATVDNRKDYRTFLSECYTRYGVVIGVSEAERAFGEVPIDEKFFMENSTRLEHRLRALGLLKRLSDDCAYVINPFGARGS